MTYTRRLYKQDDNSVGRLASGISAGSLSIPMQAGQGALFPTTFYGVTTSLGTATLLNCTGIQALGVVAGMIIQNITDGSYAIVLSVSTNSVTTTNLKGGSANVWGNTEKWVVNPFVVTLVNYDTDGVTVLKREKVLIDYRTTDTLFVNSAGRGFDGSSAQTFSTNDYVYLFSIAATIDGIQEGLAQILQDIETLPTAVQISAMAGSSGLPNSTNKFLTEDDATTFGQGLSQTTQNATIAVGEANATTKFNKVHQTFIATNTSFIAFYLYKKANTGTNAGNVIIQLTAVDGSNNPTGGVLATCTILAAAWNALTVDAQNYMAWSVPYTMTVGTTYALQITQSTADNSNHINLGYQNTDVYTSGVLKRWNTTDGYVTVTGDLYFSFLGTTNNKLVRRTSNGQIYQSAAPATGTDLTNKTYVDAQIASAITTFPLEQQVVGVNNLASATNCAIAASSDGNTMVVFQGKSSLPPKISRYVKDKNIWYRTHSVDSASGYGAYAQNGAICIIGSFVYIYFCDSTSNIYVKRFNLADLTSEATMTLSGGSPTTTNENRAMFTDGTNMYLSNPGVSGEYKRYSISGTTATFSANLNYTSMAGNEPAYCDGTNVYQIKGTPVINILKWALAGGAVVSSTNRNLGGHFTNEVPSGIVPYNATYWYAGIWGTIDSLIQLELSLMTKP
jgi:hypothetical protein